MASAHEPVMVSEVVALLAPGRGGLFVDCTVGLGGHSRALLEAGADRVLGLDRDPQALAAARAALAGFHDRVELVHADYRDLDRVLEDRGIRGVAGALADLGVSSMQLDAEGRGFSFRRDEPLDMRMDQSRGPSAADLLRETPEGEIADVIFRFGEERYSRRVYQRIDPATRTFQALRIWVNRELDGLEGFLERAAARLLATARLAVITFHSLEDRIVKHTFRALEKGDGLRILTKRPLVPAVDETARNPRARSAKLRAIERFA